MVFKMGVCVALLISLLLVRILNRWGFKRLKSRLNFKSLFIIEKVVFYGVSTTLVVFALQLLGLDIEGILATAGILTIAVGFAAKTSISNLISGGIMLSTKMIQIEDLIEVGEHVGIVENVDFFSTKLRTFDNILISIPNEKLMTEYVKNYSQYSIRRSLHHIVIHYDDFHQDIMDQIQSLLSEVDGVLIEPQPLALVESQQGGGVCISIRVWCEAQDIILVKDRLMTDILLLLKASQVRLWDDRLYIRSS